MTTNIGQALLESINNGLQGIIVFIPKFVAGTIILLIGIIIASILKQALIEIFKAANVEGLLKKYGVPEGKKELSWTNILAEIVRWFVVIVFLIPTTDILGLPQVVTVLNTFLLYLPNVFVAAIIALIGFVVARLVHDIVLASSREISPETSHTIASAARWAISIFVILAVLNQLGVANDLVRILFTGFVAMIAIAGGIAFGLGGKNAAEDIVNEIRGKIK